MDAAAFADLLRRNAGLVHRVAAAYARDLADREDIVQEAAIQLWQAADRFDGRGRESTFVYRIAFNVAMSFHRRQRRHRQRREDVDVHAIAIAPLPEPDARTQSLLTAISGLPPFDRALVLLWLDDNDHAAIAEVLGISVSNVGTKLHRIKQRLRDFVARQQAAEERDGDR